MSGIYTRSRWTAGEDRKLAKLLAVGMSADEVGRALMRSAKAIRTRAAACKLSIRSTAVSQTRKSLQSNCALVRYDYGGVIGPRWSFAHRSNATRLDDAYLEAMLDNGLITETRLGGGLVYQYIHPIKSEDLA